MEASTKASQVVLPTTVVGNEKWVGYIIVLAFRIACGTATVGIVWIEHRML